MQMSRNSGIERFTIVNMAIKHIEMPIAICQTRKLNFLGVRLITGYPRMAPMKPATPMT